MSMTAIHVELMELHQQLLGMLADCERSKEPEPLPKCDRSKIPAGYWMDSSCRLHRITKVAGRIQLGGVASNEQRVQVDPGEGALGYKKKSAAPRKKPENVDPLVWKLQLATWDCQDKTVRANEAYFRCLATKGMSPKSCRYLYTPVSCPDVEKYQDMLNAVRKDTFEGQGGQFGGGGASGSF